MAETNSKYDVFISYRRKTGVNDARLLQQALKTRGYEVFFDYDSLRVGKFDEKIFEAIKEAAVFILMLTEGALDGCANEEDWVRAEIESAIDNGKQIIPVSPSDQELSFPDNLPTKLKEIPLLQVSELNKTSLFDESVDKIVQNCFPEYLARRRSSLLKVGVSTKVLQLSGQDWERERYKSPNDSTVLDGIEQSIDCETRIFVQPSEEVRTYLKGLKPTEREASSGFRVVEIGDETILLSDAVNNALLKSGADAMRVDVLAESGNPYSKALERKDATASHVLEWKRKQSRGNFRNESKIGLATDIVLDENGNLPAVVSVFKTDYFASYRTNELPTMDVFEEGDGGISRIWAGNEHFPVVVDQNGVPGMTPFLDPGYSNHLGGNTLGVTDDGHLVLWLQSNKAERSRNRWAPTGSGSLDWSDLDANGSLLRTIQNGAARELREECRIINDAISIVTKVIGFYRWCSRGGLPGFLCVSRIGCEVSRLSPDTSEVNIISGHPMIGLRPARNKARLIDTVQDILDGSANLHCPLSTPLVANLMAVRAALSSGSGELEFLFQ